MASVDRIPGRRASSRYPAHSIYSRALGPVGPLPTRRRRSSNALVEQAVYSH